jgi:hypothetical protein
MKQGPYRKVLWTRVTEHRIQHEELECGHQVFRKIVKPEKATRRRCRKCLELAMRRVRK